MNADTCPNGGEQWEEYYSEVFKANRIQYDYRTPEGKLFSLVANDLEEARNRRDEWLTYLKTGSYPQRPKPGA